MKGKSVIDNVPALKEFGDKITTQIDNYERLTKIAKLRKDKNFITIYGNALERFKDLKSDFESIFKSPTSPPNSNREIYYLTKGFFENDKYYELEIDEPPVAWIEKD